VCTNELVELKNDYYKFAGVKILAVSSDRYWVQKAFARALNLPFPLVEDPDAMISRRYGVFSKKLGIANRAYFIIDEKGIIKYKYMTRSPKEKLAKEKVLTEVKKVKG
jgi:peroxiredoxin